MDENIKTPEVDEPTEPNEPEEPEKPEETFDPSKSILITVKKTLGLYDETKDFDPDIIMCINTAIAIISQVGIGPTDGFIVTDEKDTYEDWLGELSSGLQMVKTYLSLRVRLIFDPPTQSTVMETCKEAIRELECRLNYMVDPIWTFNDNSIAQSE